MQEADGRDDRELEGSFKRGLGSSEPRKEGGGVVLSLSDRLACRGGL